MLSNVGYPSVLEVGAAPQYQKYAIGEAAAPERSGGRLIPLNLLDTNSYSGVDEKDLSLCAQTGKDNLQSRALLFTLGCHSGYVVLVIIGSPEITTCEVTDSRECCCAWDAPFGNQSVFNYVRFVQSLKSKEGISDRPHKKLMQFEANAVPDDMATTLPWKRVGSYMGPCCSRQYGYYFSVETRKLKKISTRTIDLLPITRFFVYGDINACSTAAENVITRLCGNFSESKTIENTCLLTA